MNRASKLTLQTFKPTTLGARHGTNVLSILVRTTEHLFLSPLMSFHLPTDRGFGLVFDTLLVVLAGAPPLKRWALDFELPNKADIRSDLWRIVSSSFKNIFHK